MIACDPGNLRDAYRAVSSRPRQPKPEKLPPPAPIVAVQATPEMPIPGQKQPRQAIDNRFYGETAACEVCGREFRAVGRNWKYRKCCSPKCTNRAWMRAHPRKAA